MRTRFLLLIFFLPMNLQAQNSGGGFWKLTGPEKWWVIFHPFVARKAYRISLEARQVSDSMRTDTVLDGDGNGGQVDAFRHAYWMARLSQEMCWRKARSLGKAHEKGNYKAFKKGRTEEGVIADSALGAMDLYNNDVGLSMGCRMRDTPQDSLQRAVRDSVKAGTMQVILKNSAGQALDCKGAVIDPLMYKGQWNIPKCLMRSDYRKR